MIPGWLARELAGGPITFERFMELALYHPEHGYYPRHIRGVGRGGDFSTSATLSLTLAAALSQWVREETSALQVGPPYHLIELGPGDGSLARDILAALPWTFRRKCRLHLVDVSPPLRAQQESTLARFRRRVSWHASLTEALAAVPPGAHPLIYSNEFFDAFPVRVFRRVADDLRELMIENHDGLIRESWGEAGTTPPSSTTARRWHEGHRFEIADRARRWLHDNLSSLDRGSLLTIDYGGTAEEIYHRRPHGTLRGYFLHHAVSMEALYANPGHQDLTADVNFDDLQAWTEDLGFKTGQLMTQREFLTPFSHPRSEVDRFLSGPLGAGEAFKVLIQRKG